MALGKNGAASASSVVVIMPGFLLYAHRVEWLFAGHRKRCLLQRRGSPQVWVKWQHCRIPQTDTAAAKSSLLRNGELSVLQQSPDFADFGHMSESGKIQEFPPCREVTGFGIYSEFAALLVHLRRYHNPPVTTAHHHPSHGQHLVFCSISSLPDMPDMPDICPTCLGVKGRTCRTYTYRYVRNVRVTHHSRQISSSPLLRASCL
jgi:hypothetical protein